MEALWCLRLWTCICCCRSVAQSCLTLCDHMSYSTPFTISWSLLKLMSIESMIPSNHLILCHPRPLLLLPSIFSSIRVFSNELALCIRWPEYWNFSFSISLSNEYSGLISFRTDWFDLFAVQGPLKCLFQHRNLKASVLWCSTFFMAQHSHLYMTTGKTIAFTVQTFVSTCIISLFIQIFGGEGNYHPLLYMKKQAWEKFKKLS